MLKTHFVSAVRLMLVIATIFTAMSLVTASAYTMKKAPLMTRWASQVDPANPLPEYPRPQLVRSNWQNLNGVWQFQSGTAGDPVPAGKKLAEDILVPYPIESAISGVMAHHDRVWYRRTFTVPSTWSGQRIMLNFGAVDWESEVFINGKSVGIHHGGYDAFSYDITSYLVGTGDQELIVRIFDPTENGGQPRGKQAISGISIMYTPTTGIWQSVWLEPVPQIGISNIKIVPDVDNSTVKLTVNTVGATDGVTVSVEVKDGGAVVQSVSDSNPNTELTIQVPDPKLWSPSSKQEMTVRAVCRTGC